MIIRDVAVTFVEIPQIAPIAPYRSHIRTSSTTCSAIVRVETDDGCTGWGEFNINFLEDVSEHRSQGALQAWAIGRDPCNIRKLHQECPLDNRLKAGLEIACWDILGKSKNMSVAELLGGVIRPRVEVAACMGIQSYERAGEIATEYVARGFGTLKTKAGSDADEDLEMVRGIRDAVGMQLKLRIDPNRAYSPQEAAELAKKLEPHQLEYFEQPIPAEPLSDAAWLRTQTTTPIALNESVVEPDSVVEILRANAAEQLLPDTHIAGGIWPCVQIGEICHADRVPVIMHCGHDLGPKTAAMVHVGAACPAYSLANDTTYYGLEDDVIREPFSIEEGMIAVPVEPGLGIEVDPRKLERYRMS